MDEIFLHVFAPVMVAYTQWLLKKAYIAGKKRIYFLARDGWMMYQTAQALTADGQLDLELRYLKVSRYSIRRAEYHLLGEKCLDTICVGGINISFEKIMKRAALTEEEAIQIARLAGYEERYHKPLSFVQIQKLKGELRQIKLFFKYVYQHSRIFYEDTAGYLRQEGMLEDIPYILADSGWIGTLQRSLQHLISNAKGQEKNIEGCYFGLYEIPNKELEHQFCGYYFTPTEKLRNKIKFSNCLFEAVFSSPEGMTLGYCLKNGRYKPVESSTKNPNGDIIRRHAKLLKAYIEEYIRAENSQSRRKTEGTMQAEFLHSMEKKLFSESTEKRQFPDNCAEHTDRIMVEKLLSKLMSTPTFTEAKAFGALLFCDDVLELQMQTVAAEYSMEELKQLRLINRLLCKLGIREEELHESAWPEGSITLAGSSIRENLRQERWYKRFMYIRKAIKAK